MASARFARALDAVLRHEGGYVDHRSDPGGATNLGVTRATLSRWRGRAVSKAEVRALTRAEATEIYRELYWDKIAGDALPAGLDLAVFDYCVNSGPGRAARTLQRILGTIPDGRIGPVDLAAIEGRPVRDLVSAYCRRRLSFLEGLRSFAVFGRGWRRRVHEIEAIALALTEQPRAAGLPRYSTKEAR